MTSPRPGAPSLTWPTVRVFVSSTFLDMDSERDHLVRFVFPRLRETLLARRVHLIDIDLRWGVTSEQDATEACREIIDECGVFVGLLGERYGQVSATGERSITAEEIHHGPLRLPRRPLRSFFYFRDPDALTDIPAPHADAFREPAGSPNADRLADLKRAIVAAGYEPRGYTARWDPDRQRLTGLMDFGEALYRDVLAAALESLPATELPPPDELEREAAAMTAFVDVRTVDELAGSRERALGRLTAFALGSTDPGILAVQGAPGLGKTTLLAELTRWAVATSPPPSGGTSERPGTVFAHFVGATAASSSFLLLLRRMAHALRQAGCDAELLAPDRAALVASLPKLVAGLPADQRVLMVLDGLDQLDAADEATGLSWLPLILPENVRIVVSGSSPPGRSAGQSARVAEQLDLEPLTAEDARHLVAQSLHRYRKRLTSAQLEALLAKGGARHPLFLRAAVEELRTLGRHDEMTALIEQLPADPPSLFRWIFRRLSSDPEFQDQEGRFIGPPLVRAVASGLASSRHGLSLDELCRLVGRSLDAAHGCDAVTIQGHLSALERLLRPYLIRRGELLGFFHSQVRDAVVEEFLADERSRRGAHGQLVGLFRDPVPGLAAEPWRRLALRALGEIPYHLLLAGRVDEVGRVLLDAEYLAAVCSGGAPDGADRSDQGRGVEVLIDALLFAARHLGAEPDRRARSLAGQLAQLSGFAIERRRLAERTPLIIVQDGLSYGQLPARPTIPSSESAEAQMPSLRLRRAAGSGASRRGHTASVILLASVEGGDGFLSAGKDGAVALWRRGHRDPRWLTSAHKGGVSWLTASPDGKHALTTGDEGRILLWRVEEGSYRVLFDEFHGAGRWPSAPFGAFVGDGSVLAVRSGIGIRLSAESGEVLWRRSDLFASVGRRVVSRCAIATKAHVFALGDDYGDIVVRATTTGDELARFRLAGPVAHVALTADGRVVVGIDHQGHLLAGDPSSGAVLARRRGDPLASLCSSASAHDFFGCRLTGEVLRLSIRESLQIDTRDDPWPARGDGRSPGALLALGSAPVLVAGLGDGAIAVYDWDQARVVEQWPAGGGLVKGAICPAGEGSIAIEGDPGVAGHLAGDGRRLLRISRDGEAYPMEPPPGMDAPVGCAALGPNVVAAVGRNGVAAVWRRGACRPYRVREVEFSACAAWPEAGLLVAGTTRDDVVIVSSGRRAWRRHLPGTAFEHTAGIAAVAAGGSRPVTVLAAYGNGRVRYEGASRWLGDGHALTASAAALHHRRGLGATGDIDGEVVVWDCRDGGERVRAKLHDGTVTALAFDLAGDLLFSAGTDRCVLAMDPFGGQYRLGTMLPAAAVALRVEPPNRLHVLDAQGTLYEFEVRGLARAQAEGWSSWADRLRSWWRGFAARF